MSVWTIGGTLLLIYLAFCLLGIGDEDGLDD
jgi:hypothetical protein